MTVLSGPGSFHCCIQRQNICFIGNIANNRNFGGNIFHRFGRGNRILTHPSDSFRCLNSNLLRLQCVIGILLNIRNHFFHGGGNLLGRRCLFAGSLRYLLRTGTKLFTGSIDIIGTRHHIPDNIFQLLYHVLQGTSQFPYLIFLLQNLVIQIHRKVTLRNSLGKSDPIIESPGDIARNNQSQNYGNSHSQKNYKHD